MALVRRVIFHPFRAAPPYRPALLRKLLNEPPSKEPETSGAPSRARPLGDYLDDRRHRVGAPEGRLGTAQHLDALDFARGDAAEIEAAAVEIGANPVDQHDVVVLASTPDEKRRRTATLAAGALNAGPRHEAAARPESSVEPSA